jgi:hypothetical protein
LIIGLLVPELRLSHDPIDRFFEQSAVEAAHMRHAASLLLQHAGHLAGRLDLAKIRLQIEFEQSLDRALAAEPLAKASLQYVPRRVETNEKVWARDQLQPAPDDPPIGGSGQQDQRAECREKALVEDDDPIRCSGHLPGP